MCKYNFNPRPQDKITSKVEIDFKKSKKDRKKAFKEVLKETEIPKDCNCLKCQKDKTPPASKDKCMYCGVECEFGNAHMVCHEIHKEAYGRGKSEGRKDVLDKVEKIGKRRMFDGNTDDDYVMVINSEDWEKLKRGERT